MDDNLSSTPERSEFVRVFSFQDEDLLYARPGRRSINAGSPQQTGSWRSLPDKLEQELRA